MESKLTNYCPPSADDFRTGTLEHVDILAGLAACDAGQRAKAADLVRAALRDAGEGERQRALLQFFVRDLQVPEPWCGREPLARWASRIERADLVAAACQQFDLRDLARGLPALVRDATADLEVRPDLPLLANLVVALAQQAAQRTPWVQIATTTVAPLPEQPAPTTAQWLVVAWAAGHLHARHARQLRAAVAAPGVWQQAYRAWLGRRTASLSWRAAAVPTMSATVLDVALPHLGENHTARVVAEGARLLLHWPGVPVQQWRRPRESWGDSITGPLETDVVGLDSDEAIDLRQTLHFVQERRLAGKFSEADGQTALGLLRRSALLAAVERLAKGVRVAQWNASESDVALVSAAAKLRVELELAARRMPRGALRAELREVDRELEAAGIVAAVCVIEPSEVESLAEATGTALGGWWLSPMDLANSGHALAAKLAPSWWQSLTAPLHDWVANFLDTVAHLSIPAAATAGTADFSIGPYTLFGFRPMSASWIPGLGVLAKGVMPARNPAETDRMTWHLVPAPTIAQLSVDGVGFDRSHWQGGSISWPVGGAEQVTVAVGDRPPNEVTLPKPSQPLFGAPKTKKSWGP